MIERYSRTEMTEIWSEKAKYVSWSKVEMAHLETLVETAECPKDALADFSRAFGAKTSEDYLRREMETAHDVIAFVAEVGEEMGPLTGPFLHKGLTSSDVVDTALSLRIRQALGLIDTGLSNWKQRLAELAFRHSKTLTIGRTHGIHAEPCSFGQIVAGYFAEAARAHQKVLAAMNCISTGKLSGAVGVYSQLGPDFESRVLARLGLRPETAATQVLPRDRILDVARAVEDVAICIERFALNIRHLARTEVGEALEAFGTKQKGSSAMPHKKNPVLSENLCGLARVARAAVLAIAQNTALWHERDISHSSVERMALPDLFVTVDFMLARVSQLTEGLDVSPKAMQKNLDLTGGLWASGTLLTALVDKGMNRTIAYELVQGIALPLAKQVREESVQPGAFLQQLVQHAKIREYFSETELKEILGTERFLKHSGVVFERTFGISPEKLHWPDGAAFPASKVPALRRSIAVTVQLQPDVLDTEARTISADMKHTVSHVCSMRQSKTFHIDVLPDHNLFDSVPNKNSILADLEKYAQEVLHNEVMEDFRVEVVR